MSGSGRCGSGAANECSVLSEPTIHTWPKNWAVWKSGALPKIDAPAKALCMSTQTKLLIIGLLILATAFEVSGDAIVRLGLGSRAALTKVACFLAGAVLLFAYGLTLNLAPLPFHKVVGIYIATLFVMWQLISFLFFRTVPSLPIIVGGALIVGGGLVVAFWERALGT